MFRVISNIPVAYFSLWRIKGRLHSDMAFLRQQVELDSSSPPPLSVSDPLILDLYESVRIAARLHYRPTDCLPRSICLAELLRKRGIKARVKIGVNRSLGKLFSHAWVEIVDGSDCQILSEPANVTVDFTSIGKRSHK